MSAGFIVPFKCRHSSTLHWSIISPTLLATKTCCLLWAECSHWRTVIESVQCVTVRIWISWSSVTNLPQSHKIECSLQFQLRVSLLLHSGNSTHPNDEWQFHSIIIFCSQVSYYTHWLQRGIWEKMQISFLVIFVKITSLQGHGFQFSEHSDPVKEPTFVLFINLVIPMLSTFGPDCFR